VSSKQTRNIFGLNRKEPKLNLFRLCFGLFHETKKYFFRLVSVFRTCIETTETNMHVSKQTETNLKIHLNNTHIQVQRGLDSCRQTCPGASQSVCRQTRTRATTFSCRQTRPVQLKALVSRSSWCSTKALVDRHVQMKHRLL
jgi:hypothetical protein